MQRKLTVIPSADEVSFSELMERDEAGTLVQSSRNGALRARPDRTTQSCEWPDQSKAASRHVRCGVAEIRRIPDNARQGTMRPEIAAKRTLNY